MPQHLQQLSLSHLTVEKLVSIFPVKRSHQVATFLIQDALHLRKIQLTLGFLVRAGLIQRTRLINLTEHRGGHQAVSLCRGRVLPCLSTRLDSTRHTLAGIGHGGNVARLLLADTLRHQVLHMLRVPCGRLLNQRTLHTGQPGTKNHRGRQLLRPEHRFQLRSILRPVIPAAHIGPAKHAIADTPLQQRLRRRLQRTFLQHTCTHFQRRATIERPQQGVPHIAIPRNLLQNTARGREPGPATESNLFYRHRSSGINERAPLSRARLQALKVSSVFLLIVRLGQSQAGADIRNKERSSLTNHRPQRVHGLGEEISRLGRLITRTLGSIQHTAHAGIHRIILPTGTHLLDILPQLMLHNLARRIIASHSQRSRCISLHHHPQHTLDILLAALHRIPQRQQHIMQELVLIAALFLRLLHQREQRTLEHPHRLLIQHQLAGLLIRIRKRRHHTIGQALVHHLLQPLLCRAGKSIAKQAHRHTGLLRGHRVKLLRIHRVLLRRKTLRKLSRAHTPGHHIRRSLAHHSLISLPGSAPLQQLLVLTLHLCHVIIIHRREGLRARLALRQRLVPLQEIRTRLLPQLRERIAQHRLPLHSTRIQRIQPAHIRTQILQLRILLQPPLHLRILIPARKQKGIQLLPP